MVPPPDQAPDEKLNVEPTVGLKAMVGTSAVFMTEL